MADYSDDEIKAAFGDSGQQDQASGSENQSEQSGRFSDAEMNAAFGGDASATPSAPAATAPKPMSLSSGYGASPNFDLSGRPYAMVPMTIPKTFMSPETTVSVEDKTRVAPNFDPTVAQPLTREQTTNPRMKESVSRQLRQELGADAFQELDHAMPLELGGSNDKSNMRLETAQDPSQPYRPGSNPTPTDKLENDLGHGVKTGKISMLDAWRQMAQAKGLTLKEDSAKNTGFWGGIQNYLLNSPRLLPALAKVQDIAEGVGNYIKQAFIHPKEATVGAGMAVENFGLGVAKTLTKAVGAQGAADWIQENKDALNQLEEEQFQGDKGKAYTAGNFVGQMIPYYLTGGVASKILTGVSIPLLAKYGGDLTASAISKIGTVLSETGNLSGFLGTGQIIHDPQDGSRADQLKSDLITYLAFEGVLRGIPTALKTVFSKLKGGEKITLAEGEAAIEEANDKFGVKPPEEPPPPPPGGSGGAALAPKSTQARPEGRSGAISPPEAETGPKTEIPQNLKSLANMAKKYESADEFVKRTVKTTGQTAEELNGTFKAAGFDGSEDFYNKSNAVPREPVKLSSTRGDLIAKAYKSKSVEEFADSITYADSKKIKGTIDDFYNQVKSGEIKPSRQALGKPSKIGLNIQAKAIEADLTKGFSRTAGYDPITVKDQAAKIADMINDNFQNVRDIVNGKEPVPRGISGTYLISAVEDHAYKSGDVELLRDLAKSPLTSATSVYAQELRMAAEREQGPVKYMQEIIKARENASKLKFGDIEKARARAVNEIKESIKTATRTRKVAWAEFAESLKC